MNTPTHTPTPFRVEIDHRATADYVVTIKAADGEPTVALIVQPEYCTGAAADNARALAKAKANAEFIVRACNSHQRRTDLLADLMEWAGQMGGWEAPCWAKVRAELALDRPTQQNPV